MEPRPDAGLRLLDGRGGATWLPWPDVFDRAAVVAAWLADLGLRPGERVGLVFPTGPGFIDAFFGVLLAGGVPAPLYPPVRLGRLDEYLARTSRMLRAIDAALLLADARAQAILRARRRSGPPAPRMPHPSRGAARRDDARREGRTTRPGPSRPRPRPVLLRHDARPAPCRPHP